MAAIWWGHTLLGVGGVPQCVCFLICSDLGVPNHPQNHLKTYLHSTFAVPEGETPPKPSPALVPD